MCQTSNTLHTYWIKEGICESYIKELQDILMHLGFLSDIRSIQRIKKGMTNRLYYINSAGNQIVVRIPGEKSSHFVDRKVEANVYELIQNAHIAETVLYFNPVSGIKITRYLCDVANCDSKNLPQVERCIAHLKKFHDLNLEIGHSFDIFSEIERYEEKCREELNLLEGYDERRKKVFSLKNSLDLIERKRCLCHIDPVSDNFLVSKESIYLIDWEYAAMSDPLVDIAMFCIYADYDRYMTDQIIHVYLKGEAEFDCYFRVYSYMAAGALLWVLWCEIKKKAGVYYTSYEKTQYDIVNRFYEYAVEVWYRLRR